jgi:hypothetical protein
MLFRSMNLIRRPDVAPAAIHSGQPARAPGGRWRGHRAASPRASAPLRTNRHVAIAFLKATRRRPLSSSAPVAEDQPAVLHTPEAA